MRTYVSTSCAISEDFVWIMNSLASGYYLISSWYCKILIQKLKIFNVYIKFWLYVRNYIFEPNIIIISLIYNINPILITGYYELLWLALFRANCTWDKWFIRWRDWKALNNRFSILYIHPDIIFDQFGIYCYIDS